MEGYRRKPRRDTVQREVSGVQDRSKRKDRNRRERLALRNKVKKEEHLRDLRGIKGRDRNGNVFPRPNGLRENAETAISSRGPGPRQK